MKILPQTPPKNIAQIAKTLLNLHDELLSWDAVAERYGLTKPLVWRIAYKGYEPKKPFIRRRLGLPVFIPAPACPECGQVHRIDDVCIEGREVSVIVYEAEPRQPKRQSMTVKIKRRARKDNRNRASINLASAESAARTIRRKMDAGTLAALIELLREEQGK